MSSNKPRLVVCWRIGCGIRTLSALPCSASLSRRCMRCALAASFLKSISVYNLDTQVTVLMSTACFIVTERQETANRRSIVSGTSAVEEHCQGSNRTVESQLQLWRISRDTQILKAEFVVLMEIGSRDTHPSAKVLRSVW